MNQKQLLALFLFLVVIASSRLIKNSKYEQVEVKSVSVNIDKYSINNIFEEEGDYKKNIFYPITKSDIVNKHIQDMISNIQTEFNETSFSGEKKTLEVTFDMYEYNEYASFKFTINSDIGMNHMVTKIITISYKDNQIVDFSYLESKNSRVLDVIKEEINSVLSGDSRIKEYSNEVWLNEGIASLDSGNINFVFMPNKFVVIINPYVVGPYVAGIFEIEIDYSKIIN